MSRRTRIELQESAVVVERTGEPGCLVTLQIVGEQDTGTLMLDPDDANRIAHALLEHAALAVLARADVRRPENGSAELVQAGIIPASCGSVVPHAAHAIDDHFGVRACPGVMASVLDARMLSLPFKSYDGDPDEPCDERATHEPHFYRRPGGRRAWCSGLGAEFRSRA